MLLVRAPHSTRLSGHLEASVEAVWEIAIWWASNNLGVGEVELQKVVAGDGEGIVGQKRKPVALSTTVSDLRGHLDLCVSRSSATVVVYGGAKARGGKQGKKRKRLRRNHPKRHFARKASASGFLPHRPSSIIRSISPAHTLRKYPFETRYRHIYTSEHIEVSGRQHGLVLGGCRRCPCHQSCCASVKIHRRCLSTCMKPFDIEFSASANIQ